MIIGVSGLAGSGKNAVADILVRKHGFVPIAFADPMKRFVQDVYDFSDEQLWGESDKRVQPDERYPRVHPNHCCQGAAVGSPEWHKPRVCTTCGAVGGDPPSMPEGPCVTHLTPRYALQKLGTEWGRDCYANTWVDYAIRVAKNLIEQPCNGYVYCYTPKGGQWLMPVMEAHASGVPKVEGVIITDVRFWNEFRAIREAGGFNVRTIRPGAGLQGAYAEHVSETQQAEIPDGEFHGVIQNDGTLADLEGKVEQFLAWCRSRKG